MGLGIVPQKRAAMDCRNFDAVEYQRQVISRRRKAGSLVTAVCFADFSGGTQDPSLELVACASSLGHVALHRLSDILAAQEQAASPECSPLDRGALQGEGEREEEGAREGEGEEGQQQELESMKKRRSRHWSLGDASSACNPSLPLEPCARLAAHRGPALGLLYHPRALGQPWLWSCGEDGKILGWKLREWAESVPGGSAKGPQGPATDTQHLLTPSISLNSTPQLSSTSSSQSGSLTIPRVSALACSSPSSSLLLSASGAGQAQAWDLSAASAVRSFVGHSKPLTCIAAAQGQSSLMATGAQDGTVRVWDVRSPNALVVLHPWRGTASRAVNGRGNGATQNCGSAASEQGKQQQLQHDSNIWALGNRNKPLATTPTMGTAAPAGPAAAAAMARASAKSALGAPETQGTTLPAAPAAGVNGNAVGQSFSTLPGSSYLTSDASLADPGVSALCMTEDGRWLVAGTDYGTVSVFSMLSLGSSPAASRFIASANPITDVTPMQSKVLVASGDTRVNAWTLEGAPFLRRNLQRQGHSLQLHPTLEMIAVGEAGGYVDILSQLGCNVCTLNA